MTLSFYNWPPFNHAGWKKNILDPIAEALGARPAIAQQASLLERRQVRAQGVLDQPRDVADAELVTCCAGDLDAALAAARVERERLAAVAARLPDDAARERFWRDVPEHRRLVELTRIAP
jgi:hypothetical protein